MSSCYVLYLQDYGGPLGLRIATAHPERVAGLVIQNANGYLDSFGPKAGGPVPALWDKVARRRPRRRPVSYSCPKESGSSAPLARDPDTLSPYAWTLDRALVARPGRHPTETS